MIEENINQVLRLRKIDETRNYFSEEIKHNGYIEQSLILVFSITGYVLILASASLISIPLGISSSAVGLKICVITAGIKKYKPVIKKKRKKNMIK